MDKQEELNRERMSAERAAAMTECKKARQAVVFSPTENDINIVRLTQKYTLSIETVVMLMNKCRKSLNIIDNVDWYKVEQLIIEDENNDVINTIPNA